MGTTVAEIDYIQIVAGTNPRTDGTDFQTTNYTASDKIRFFNGLPEKVGGNSQLITSGSLSGVPRSYWSAEINGKSYALIGTNSRLYVLIGSNLLNITPVRTSSNAAANSLSTQYSTLGSNPISTTINSNVVTVTDSDASRFVAGDKVTLSGATATGGLGTGVLNAQQTIHTVGIGSYTFIASATATSTATGGGASVLRRSGLIRVTVANTLANGDRVKIAGAVDTGGILAASINLEFIIRTVSSSYFDIMTASTATSSVTAAGGASTVYYPPMAAGNVDETYQQGYGMGQYGVGLYGVSKVSTSARAYPRLWYFDRFGDYIMITAGNGTGLYEWLGDTTTAPVLTAGAPTSINYMFVSDNSIVVFGNGGTENRITASDVGNRLGWTGTAQNQFYDDNIEGADKFISHISVQGLNLIFTEHQVWSFRYIGLPNVWEIKKLANVGIISPFGGIEVNGVAYWMSPENWYYWSGANISVLQSNTQPCSTILRYTFDNINTVQKSKVFCYYNKKFQELRWSFPSANSLNPDSQACMSIPESSWWGDTLSRSAAERPAPLLTYQRMVDINGNIYEHEKGYDDNGNPMAFSLTTNLRTVGKREALLSAFTPDSIQTNGNINVKISAMQYPQAVDFTEKDFEISPTSRRIESGAVGRYWKYTISGEALGQFWRMGKWSEEKQVAGDGR